MIQQTQQDNRFRLAGHVMAPVSFLFLLALGAWGLAIQKPLIAQDPAQPAFVDITDSVGQKGMSGGVAAWGDMDNDGWVDLCVSGQIWRNEKGKQFKKVADVPGAGIWGDYDNDGFLDLFCFETGRLFRNIGGKSFEEKKILPKLPTEVCLGAIWGDFNGDGYLDLYIGGYEVWPDKEYPDVILLSEKGERFVETWRQSPILRARGITAADFDEDGSLDVFVSNYRLQPNLLWKNNGKGKFTNVAKEYGAQGNEKLGAYAHTIGSCWGDLDNDGHLDLFVGNFSHPPDYQDRSQFLRNMGPKHQFHFEDKTKVAKLRWQESYASPTLGDFDNDGLLDLYFTTVYPGDKSVLYRNRGEWKFDEVPGALGLSLPQTYQAAWADFDQDGDLDLITGGRLFRNPGNKNHWLQIQLKATGKSNRAAIGSQVRIQLGDKTLTRQVESATGQGNQNDMTLHFGLKDHQGPVKGEIRWPDGTRQNFEAKSDQILRITQGKKIP